MSNPFHSRQFLRFLATGGIAAAVNFGSRILYEQWMGFSAAVLLAYLTGMLTAFVLWRALVFRESTQALHRAGAWFVLVNLLAVAQTWVISLGLAYHVLPGLGVVAHARDIAHAIGIAVPVFTSYLGHRRWSFR